MKRITLILLTAAAFGCVGDEEITSATLEVSDGSGSFARLADDETLETPTEDRSAIVAILKGAVTNSPQPYTAEFIRAIDAPLFRDVDATDDGAEQWVTRARVLDAEGNVLWQDRINSFFQLIEYLGIILRESSPIQLNTLQVYTFAKNNYPSLIEFPVRIPTGIEGGVTYELVVPDEEGQLYSAFSIPIAEVVESATPPQYEGEIVDIVDNGPPEDRLDVVILGDGYIASDRAEFELDAQAVTERLLATPPFDAHADMINVRAVWTPSAMRGAAYDCTGNLARDRYCLNDFKDTVYGTVFVMNAIADQLNLDLGEISDRAAMPLAISRLYDVAAPALYDEILLISNTNRRSGFAGIYAAIVTAFDTRIDFPDVAVHELGHSFALLGDEYQVRGDACLYNEPRVPLPVNIADEFAYDELKWASWVDPMTPLPTPGNQASEYPVGAYEGAYNCDFLYRPARTCKMLRSTEEFCPVCSEQVSRRFFAVVDPVRNDVPSSVTGRADGSLEFTVTPFENSDVRWVLDGETVGDTSTLTLLPGDVSDESTLEAIVEEARGYIVDRLPRETGRLEWRVRTVQ